MRKRNYYILGVGLLVAFAGFSLASFKTTLTQYVPYEVARARSEQTVQVAGALEKGSSAYDEASQSLFFTLTDPKSHETIRVRYKGLKPANFEDAISIVAIGRYDSTQQTFTAEKLLVKCPSKYQGAEIEKTYS
jgi:cytochrome c-type biogenesis protein CcmE